MKFWSFLPDGECGFFVQWEKIFRIIIFFFKVKFWQTLSEGNLRESLQVAKFNNHSQKLLERRSFWNFGEGFMISPSPSRFWKFLPMLNLPSKGRIKRWINLKVRPSVSLHCSLSKKWRFVMYEFFQKFRILSVRTRAKETTWNFFERGLSWNKDCKDGKSGRLALQCLARSDEMKFEDVGEKKILCSFFEIGTQGSTKLWTIMENYISRNKHKTVKWTGSLIKFYLLPSSDI